MPANPIFGGWGNYARQRNVPLNNNPNLSQAEYAARMASMGNPTNAQSYQDYMASDDWAAGWRPGTTGGSRPRQNFGDIFQWLLGGAQGPWPQPTPSPTPTPAPTGNYAVPVQYNGIPNIIPVGANITDGTTSTANNPAPTTPTTPTTGGGYGGNYSPYLPANNGYAGNPNNMSYSGGGYPQTGIQQSTRNPNNMSYNPTPGVQYPQTLGQTPTQNANPVVVQEWANKRKGNGGNNNHNRR